MSRIDFRRALLSAAICGLLTACGGGDDTNAGIGGSGGGPGGGDTQNAGVVGSGGGPRVASVGTITGFGSVFVNGVEYFTSDDFDDNGTDFTTQFNVDGVAITRQDDPARPLRIGMVVRIEGELDKNAETGEVLEDSGRALVVVYDDDVEGPVTGIDPYVENVTTVREFTVLGTRVRVEDGVTVFDDNSDGGGVSFATLADGDVVEVSGFVDSNGVVVATRVERKSILQGGALDGVEVEVKSRVQEITVPGSQFRLSNGLLVNYTAGVLDDGLTAVAVDDFYEVKGRLNFDGTEINATEIELEDDGGFDDTEDDAKVSIEGLVSNLVVDATGSSFTINGQTVVFNSNTIFEPATLAADLVDGIKVEAEGPVVGGNLLATKIEARSGMLKVDALVSAVDSDTRTVTLVFAGVPIVIQADNRTQIRDDNDLPLLLSEIQNGQFLEVEAFVSAEGRIVATTIERDEIDEPELQARLVDVEGSAASGSITVKLNDSTVIMVSTGPQTEFVQLNDAYYVPAQAFFEAEGTDYQAGDLIKIELVSTTSTTADEVEVKSSSVTVSAPATSGGGTTTSTDTGSTDTGTTTDDTNTGDTGTGSTDPGAGDDPPITDDTPDLSGGDGEPDDSVTP